MVRYPHHDLTFKIGSEVARLQAINEFAGYERLNGDVGASEKLIEEMLGLDSYVTPYSRFAFLRAQIELIFNRRRPKPVLPLLKEYRAWCEVFRSPSHIGTFQQWFGLLSAEDQLEIGSCPLTTDHIYLSLLY